MRIVLVILLATFAAATARAEDTYVGSALLGIQVDTTHVRLRPNPMHARNVGDVHLDCEIKAGGLLDCNITAINSEGHSPNLGEWALEIMRHAHAPTGDAYVGRRVRWKLSFQDE